MSLASTGVWEVRTTGSDSNGGYFNSARGGTDYSQQDAAQASGTVTVSGTTCTATSGIFTSAIVGNAITDGTSWREITAFTSSTVVTLDSTVSWTGALVSVGGAMATPGKVAGLLVAGNDVWIKSGTYLITGTTQNTAGNIVNISTGGATGNAMRWIGYGATRGDGGTKPIIRASGISSTTLVKFQGNGMHVENITFDGNSLTSITGIELFAQGQLYKCLAQNCTNFGLYASASGSAVVLSEANACATGIKVNTGAIALGCNGHDCTFTNYSPTTGSILAFCLSKSGARGVSGSSGGVFILNCDFNGSTTQNIDIFSSPFAIIANAISTGSSGFGFLSGSQVEDNVWLFNCAGYNNTSGNVNTTVTPQQISFQTLSGDPFTNVASGDFSLNNTSGAGAACRGAGFLGTFAGGLSVGHQDIGAVQHADAGGSSGGLMLPLNFDGGF